MAPTRSTSPTSRVFRDRTVWVCVLCNNLARSCLAGPLRIAASPSQVPVTPIPLCRTRSSWSQQLLERTLPWLVIPRPPRLRSCGLVWLLSTLLTLTISRARTRPFSSRRTALRWCLHTARDTFFPTVLVPASLAHTSKAASLLLQFPAARPCSSDLLLPHSVRTSPQAQLLQARPRCLHPPLLRPALRGGSSRFGAVFNSGAWHHQ